MPHALDGRATVLRHVVLVEHRDERLVLVHLAARLLQRRRLASRERHAAGYAEGRMAVNRGKWRIKGGKEVERNDHHD